LLGVLVKAEAKKVVLCLHIDLCSLLYVIYMASALINLCSLLFVIYMGVALINLCPLLYVIYMGTPLINSCCCNQF
jgi:hypothetical protein